MRAFVLALTLLLVAAPLSALDDGCVPNHIAMLTKHLKDNPGLWDMPASCSLFNALPLNVKNL